MSDFPEEPLDSDVGYILCKPDDVLNDGRYSILRKLGWGSRSSTWLVADNNDPERILAAKVFTIHATHDGSALDEKQFYEDLGEHHSEVPNYQGSFEQEDPRGKHLVLPNYQGSFEQEDPRGKHLVLLFIHIGPSVEELRLRNASGGYLAPHIVKKIVVCVLDVLVDVHKWDMVHGAIKAENVLISSASTAKYIRSRLEVSPTAPVHFVGGTLQGPYPIVKSQPLDHGFHWNSPAEDFAEAAVYLVGFGNAHRSTKKQDRAKDIYDMGLMTFHLLSGTTLPPENIDKMEDLLKRSNNIAASDISSAAAFIKNCVKNLSDIPDAFDLLHDEWLDEGIQFE
ncbi:hypothetical protein H0H92_001648 [Tricholoma furcatifolium]|nr:hypothetical protein H0H92_001648 [Tricholoma furcatifolium]